MSFSMWLCIFFCPPLYFTIRGRWLAAVINAVFYSLAVVTILVGVGVVFWLFCVVHAALDMHAVVREQEMRRQAELMAEKMGR